MAENVFHVKNSGAWDAGQLTNLCAAYVTWEGTTVAGTKPQDDRGVGFALINVAARDLSTETGDAVTYSTGLPLAGSVSGQTLPNGDTIAVKLGTGTPGRSYRGRVFHIGMVASFTQTGDANLVSTAFGAKLITIYQALITAIHTANAAWDLCVLSRSHNLAPRANGIGTKVTNVALADGYMDYQRRRAPAHNRGG